MKKLITLLFFLLTLVSCSDSSSTLDEADTISVSPTSLTADKNGGTVSVSVKANRVPSVSSSASWLTLESRAIITDGYTLNLKVEANTETVERKATLTISVGSASQQVQVTQSALDALSVSPAKIDIDDQEQNFSLKVVTNGQPNVRIDAGWIKQIQATDDETRNFQVEANTGAARTGTISFELGNLTASVKVTQAQAVLSATVDVQTSYQTIEGFAASDCWAPAVIGRYWTQSREGIARLLFSKEFSSDGKPQGIGLSMWRSNIGAGTAEQGKSSNIGVENNGADGYNYYRRAESYLLDDLSYDWGHCIGQRYFLDQAKQYGVESIILFSNSPNVQYTRNGKGYSDNKHNANLKSDCYDDFAVYMAKVAAQYKAWGYPVTHISPVNEPQYTWDGHDQEGSGWQNAEVAKLTRELDAALTAEGLNDVKIVLGEAASWKDAIQGSTDNADCIRQFFEQGGANYVGDLAHIAPVFGGHSYWTDGTWSEMRNFRQKAAERAHAYGVGLWQTEWSMLGDGYSEFPGYDNSNPMDIALVMDKVIHNDLTVGNMSSWSFWTSMDVSRWSQQDRFMLIDFTPAGGTYSVYLEDEGSYKSNPTLWVLGNYSLFIRPGYRRINVDLTNTDRYFFGSGYLSPDGNRLVIVISNLSASALTCRLNLGNLEPKSIVSYVSTLKKELQPKQYASQDRAFSFEASSVTTFVIDL